MSRKYLKSSQKENNWHDVKKGGLLSKIGIRKERNCKSLKIKNFKKQFLKSSTKIEFVI